MSFIDLIDKRLMACANQLGNASYNNDELMLALTCLRAASNALVKISKSNTTEALIATEAITRINGLLGLTTNPMSEGEG